jgi:hypothetical protein
MLGFGFSVTKKQYFDPILGVSIKMYLLLEFKRLHIRNIHECVAEEPVLIGVESFLRISFSVFYV